MTLYELPLPTFNGVLTQVLQHKKMKAKDKHVQRSCPAFFMTSCNSSELLGSLEETFDFVTTFICVLVMFPRFFSVGFWQGDWFESLSDGNRSRFVASRSINNKASLKGDVSNDCGRARPSGQSPKLPGAIQKPTSVVELATMTPIFV
jgi:hypothetical protein